MFVKHLKKVMFLSNLLWTIGINLTSPTEVGIREEEWTYSQVTPTLK